MKYKVIPAMVFRRDDGKTASPYGACPWTSEEEKARWQLVQEGWTVENPYTGIIGVGRVPWATEAAAQLFADTHTPSAIGPGD